MTKSLRPKPRRSGPDAAYAIRMTLESVHDKKTGAARKAAFMAKSQILTHVGSASHERPIRCQWPLTDRSLLDTPRLAS